MNIVDFAMLWGPAVPLAAILIHAHWQLVYRTFPEAVRQLAIVVRQSDLRADKRHADHLAAMRNQTARLTALEAKRSSFRRVKKRSPDRRKRT